MRREQRVDRDSRAVVRATHERAQSAKLRPTIARSERHVERRRRAPPPHRPTRARPSGSVSSIRPSMSKITARGRRSSAASSSSREQAAAARRGSPARAAAPTPRRRVRVADRAGERVGRIGRGAPGSVSRRRTISCTCGFSARPWPTTACLTCPAVYSVHRQPGEHRGGDRRAARLAEQQRRLRIDVDEHFLDRDLGRPHLRRSRARGRAR